MAVQTTDFVVIGAGIAGLRAALEIASAGAGVILLSKDGPDDSSTRWAQGGIAAVMSGDDRVEDHVADTLGAGAGLCEEAAVRVMAEEGPGRVRELIDWGTRFDRDGGELSLAREGAHSRQRVLHAHGDATGRELVRALLARTESEPRLLLRPDVFAAGLLLESGRCRGVRVLEARGKQLRAIRARSVLLATGGAGCLFRETSNPPQTTGEGLAMAWAAGAELMDLEFVQFHPTVLDLPGAPRFLLSEALRGEGARLRGGEGERFLVGRHPLAELAPRDVVAREIFREISREGGRVVLDLTHLDPDFVRARFPTIHATCAAHGLDMTSDAVPVRPAAHYAMGGVRTDLHGRSSVPGLYAAGEVACPGTHGANRLASNSLLEGLVFGARAGRAMVDEGAAPPGGPAPAEGPVPPAPPPDEAEEIVGRVRAIGWEALGALRRRDDLSAARRELDGLADRCRGGPPSRPGIEAAAAVRVAALIAEGALRREESRGAHWREDFPERAAEAMHTVQDRRRGHRTVPLGSGPL
jgi:L-aspartate oxidase